VSCFCLVLYVLPYLLHHWRSLDAQSEAEAIYLKRKAELKAEAEHADERLDLLDKRVHLTSLGFREVVRKVSPLVVNIASFREPRAHNLNGLRLDPKEAKLRLFVDAENDRQYVQSGVGSGLIIQQGALLTNYHVVKEAQRVRITFASGASF